MRILTAERKDESGRDVTLIYNSQLSATSYREMYDEFVNSVPTGKTYTRLDIMIDIAVEKKGWRLTYFPIKVNDMGVDTLTETDVLGDIGDK